MTIQKHMLLFVAAMIAVTAANAQEKTAWGPSDPTPERNCVVNNIDYTWPEIYNACPEVQIKQKHDHTPMRQYRQKGWDTVVTCTQHELILTCTPYVPVLYYNGHYTVDTIPYDPPVPDFHSGLTQLPNSSDDYFCALQTLPNDFPFYFFGKKKTAFAAGGNGIITFNRNAAGQTNAYGIYNPLPWPSEPFFTNGGNNSGVNNHRDAIYGIYQDTDPRGCTGNKGIFYGVNSDNPDCRKIIASYNQLPWFSYDAPANANNDQSYQIVCYEGSNMIEIHVKRRTNSSYSSGWVHNGVLGIQDSLGTLQMPGSDMLTQNIPATGAPAAYYPAITTGGNVGTSTIEEKAFRFTPHGDPLMNYGWYRITDGNPDHNDTLSMTDDGIHSYQEPMPGDMPNVVWDDCDCPSLCIAHVREVDMPTDTTKFVFFLMFYNSDMRFYRYEDTITVGRDDKKEMNLHKLGGPDSVRYAQTCPQDLSNLVLELTYPALQQERNKNWKVLRCNGGVETELPSTLLSLGQLTENTQTQTKKQTACLTGTLPTDGLPENKIDSIYVQVSIDFITGCDSNSRFLIKVYPNFDIVEEVKKCEGERFYWTADGEWHTTNSNPAVDTVLLQSEPGCDSVVRLDLEFLGIRDIDTNVLDCKPYTWPRNDSTYYITNTATYYQDTVHVINEWGCKDILHLVFELRPLEARIRADRDHFDLDHLGVELDDVSAGNDNRTWVFPNGSTQSAPHAYYSIPTDLDSALIQLIAHSPYGCLDTDTVVLPLQRENVWVPNAFIPDNDADDNLFGTISTNSLREDMLIYNRRGELVYQCSEINCKWDGKDLNGTPCPQGVYVYIIRYTTLYEPDREHLLKGTVTLIR